MPFISGTRRYRGRKRKFVHKGAPAFAKPGYGMVSGNKRYPKSTRISHCQRLAKITGGDETNDGEHVPTKFASIDLRIQRSPFNRTLWSDLRYSETTILSAPGTTTVTGPEQIWSLNSLFKPNFSFSGHQPYQFDNIQSVYGRYRVFQVSIELIYTQPTDQAMTVFAMPQAANNTFAINNLSYNILAEKMGMWHVRSVNTSSGSNITRYHFTANIWDLEGMSYTQWIGDDGYDADVNASPSKQSVVRTAALNFLGPAGTTTVQLDANICYHAKFFHLKTSGQS